jgi:16S rRNA (guanine966-N2)-methyltransferase
MRITGGIYRSRTLHAPRGRATRPTSDRVREALFGILASARVLAGARVLDLYAGTGALAIEALSRGAERALLVERSPEAIQVLRANVESLGCGRVARWIQGDVARVVRRVAVEGPFDLVFADPPWAMVDTGVAPEALSDLAFAGAVADRAWVVLEHAGRTTPPDVAGLFRGETRRYGDTSLTFYKPAILGAPRTDVHARPPSD